MFFLLLFELILPLIYFFRQIFSHFAYILKHFLEIIFVIYCYMIFFFYLLCLYLCLNSLLNLLFLLLMKNSLVKEYYNCPHIYLNNVKNFLVLFISLVRLTCLLILRLFFAGFDFSFIFILL